MSFFRRRRRATSASLSAAPSGTGFSLLDSQLSVTGDLVTSGSLRIDGRLEGSIRGADAVVIGVGAVLAGDIHAREVVVGGTVTGNVHASERVELQSSAIVTGDVQTGSVLIQEGGIVNGRVLMSSPSGGKRRSSPGGTPAGVPTLEPATR